MQSFVVARGAVHPRTRSQVLQSGQVLRSDEFLVAILHTGYSSAGGKELFHLREARLGNLVLENLMKNWRHKQALENAFIQMDQELEPLLQQCSGPFLGKSAIFFWMTRFNSAVVVIHNGVAFAAGDGNGSVFFSRRGEDYPILRKSPGFSTERVTQNYDDNFSAWKKLWRAGLYYQQEPITDEDSLLVMVSWTLLRYLPASRHEVGLTPVLESRVHAFGLVEACKQMMGNFADDPKVLLVVPLRSQLQKFDLDRFDMNAIMCDECTDGTTLLPLEDGNPQEPPPIPCHYYWRNSRETPMSEPELDVGPEPVFDARRLFVEHRKRRFLSRELYVPGRKFSILHGDIVEWTANRPPFLSRSAIVNLLRPSLEQHEVEGDIYHLVGPGMLECLQQNKPPVGGVAITSGFDLMFDQVIHAVVPPYKEGDRDRDAELVLKDVYLKIIRLAEEHNIRVLVLPALDSGYPVILAARSAIHTFRTSDQICLENVIFMAKHISVYEAWNPRI